MADQPLRIERVLYPLHDDRFYIAALGVCTAFFFLWWGVEAGIMMGEYSLIFFGVLWFVERLEDRLGVDQEKRKTRWGF